ncbi:PH domain-containing protein [Chryseolinea sp. T2]|uniref:PH domain-containing protein n=1 Tax=Chryseolinea sp. T2 TaxID=3129255 RepID=UPI003077E2BA
MVDQLYKSKVSIGLLLFVSVALIVPSVVLISHGVWTALLVTVPAASFIINMYADTSYRLTIDGRLIIRCGYFYKDEVRVNDIRSVRSSNNILSAPALSIDRLELITCDRVLLISPRDKLQFAEQLKEMNPSIDVRIN